MRDKLLRLTVHAADPGDMVYAMRAIKDSIEHGYAWWGYRYGNTIVSVKMRQSGWTAWISKDPIP